MAEQKVEMTSVRVSNIYLVRMKKLKGGRMAVRSKRVIPVHHLKHNVTGNQHGTKMIVDFDHKYGAGQMIGLIDKAKGVVNFDAKAFIPEGYLKGRGFQLMGYDLHAACTNLNARRR
jgi:hypothetical protein